MAIKYQGEAALGALLALLSAQFEKYQPTEDGKGLSTNDFTTALKNKLDGIAENANNYTHPSNADYAHVNGLYKVTVDEFGHVTGCTAVAKADITKLGIPGQDTTYVVATATDDGLMSKDDFTKLQGIEEGANKYVHATHDAHASGFYKVTVDAEGHVTAATAVAKEDITKLGIPGALTPISVDLNDETIDNTKVAGAKAVVDFVNAKLSAVYKPQGSIKASAIPTAPVAAQEGYVYNVSEEFTTTAVFVEGAGKKYPAGTNIVVVKDGEAYKLDVLSGFIDLAPYLKAADAEKTYFTKTDAANKLDKNGDGSSLTLTGVTGYEAATNIVTVVNAIIKSISDLAARVDAIEKDYTKSADFVAMTATDVQTAWKTAFGE